MTAKNIAVPASIKVTATPLPAIPKNVAKMIEQEGRRQDGLRQMAHVALRREMALTAKYEDKLRKAETKRINAIRSVDVGNVREAALVQTTQAKTLEMQTTTFAETLRKQVESTAVAARLDQQTALAPINKNIEDLRQTMWAQQGERAQRTETGADDRWRIGALIAGGGCLVSATGATVMILALIVTIASGHLK